MSVCEARQRECAPLLYPPSTLPPSPLSLPIPLSPSVSHQKSARMKVCTTSLSRTMTGHSPDPMACSRKERPSMIWSSQCAQEMKRDRPRAAT